MKITIASLFLVSEYKELLVLNVDPMLISGKSSDGYYCVFEHLPPIRLPRRLTMMNTAVYSSLHYL